MFSHVGLLILLYSFGNPLPMIITVYLLYTCPRQMSDQRRDLSQSSRMHLEWGLTFIAICSTP